MSKIRAVIFESLRSFCRFACSSQLARSGQTRLMKATLRLSANHFGAEAPVGTFVRRRASPPPSGSR